ncbi:MAG: hypothetical protein ACTHW2_06050 [Tissierella sp.]|uniref:hypothetical protein n=1 Tax=Tissierella sp. TaxID=41274 RepID=UPI003F94DA0F
MKKRVISLLVLTILLMTSITVFAHGLFLTLEEPGVLKAEYDGGGFSPRMEVIVFDKDDNELSKGKVDDEGFFKFDKDLDVQYATVDDSMGHKARWEKGESETTEIPKVPVVIGVFAVIGGMFFINSKKSKK